MHASLVVGLALSLGAQGAKDDPKKDAPIVGEWLGVKAVAGGKERPVPAGGITFAFTADGKFIVKEGKREKPDEGTYKLDAGKDPAEIDILPPAEKKDRGAIQGIYKVDGDTLTICLARGPGVERPKKFESPEGVMLMTFKRAKKD
jgi:uncharacterized protein (TIGR03067 family)